MDMINTPGYMGNGGGGVEVDQQTCRLDTTHDMDMINTPGYMGRWWRWSRGRSADQSAGHNP